jgi:hypothetical protein
MVSQANNTERVSWTISIGAAIWSILGLTITVVTLGFMITRSTRHGEVQSVLTQHQKV